MSIVTVIGIDPGVSGGWAILYIDEGIISRIETVPMPETEVGIANALYNSLINDDNAVIAIEKVGGFIGSGHKNKAAAHTMFTFGENYGFIKGVIRNMGRQYHLIRPKEWQARFSMSKRKGEKQYKWKQRLKEKAIEQYRTIRFPLKLADAVLIATYAYHKYGRHVPQS